MVNFIRKDENLARNETFNMHALIFKKNTHIIRYYRKRRKMLLPFVHFMVNTKIKCPKISILFVKSDHAEEKDRMRKMLWVKELLFPQRTKFFSYKNWLKNQHNSWCACASMWFQHRSRMGFVLQCPWTWPTF